MKRILFIFTVVMLSTVSAFAQWDVDVSWITDQSCECSTTGFYVIQLNIEDVANGTFDEDYYLTVSMSASDCTFNYQNCTIKSDLQDHCDDLSNTYPPNYTITATVVLFCNDTSPPEALCNGTGFDTGISCDDFDNDTQTINDVPVD